MVYHINNGQVLSETDDAGVTQRWYVYGNYIDEPLRMTAPCLAGMYPGVNFASHFYYIQDALYNVRALVSARGIVIEEQTAYDAYGRPVTWTSGDINADRAVNAADAALFTPSYGKTPCQAEYNWRCDFNFSGTVNNLDLSCLNAYDDTATASDQQSFFTNPYYFTGRTLDFLDGGSLKLQYNRNRYYDTYTGRWLTQDPLGYVDGMNLYEYVGSNPINFIDSFGFASDPSDIDIEYFQLKFLATSSLSTLKIQNLPYRFYQIMQLDSLFSKLEYALEHIDYGINNDPTADAAYQIILNRMLINPHNEDFRLTTIMHEAIHAYNDLSDKYDSFGKKNEGIAYSVANYLFGNSIYFLRGVEDEMAGNTLVSPYDISNLRSNWNLFWGNLENGIQPGNTNGRYIIPILDIPVNFELSENDFKHAYDVYGFKISCKELADEYNRLVQNKYNGCFRFVCNESANPKEVCLVNKSISNVFK